jgi:hypothetical protein
MKKIEIIIARYNEDLDWLKKIPKEFKITIYNKGQDDIENIPPNATIIKLPNIGRESHTYLYHIIENYDKLADKTIFCQGDSIFHSPDFLKLLKNTKYFEPIQPLSAYYWPDGKEPHYFFNPPKPTLEKTKNLWIKGCRVHVEYLDNDYVTKYPYYYYEDAYTKFINKNKLVYNVNNMLKFNVERFQLKNVDLEKLIPICYSGLFCVNKEVIRENTVDFYNNIMSILIYDVRENFINGKNLDHGLFLEKLWLLIFNYRKNNKNYIDLNVKDYLNRNEDLVVNNNLIKFKISIIYCQLYIDIYIDNQLYNIMLSRPIIFFKNSYCLYKYEPRLDKPIQNALKDANIIEFEISLNNNVFKIVGNGVILIEYRFLKKKNKINKARILDLSKDNKIINLLK